MGLIQGWKMRYFPNSSSQKKPSVQELIKPIKLDHMRAMTVILFGGILLSVLAFAIEYKCSKKRDLNLLLQWKTK